MSVLRGKNPIKHGSTLLDNTGPGVGSFFTHIIYQTNVGGRSLGGGPQTIKAQASTDETCMVGDIVKYLNVCIECGPRGATSTNVKEDGGWLEWGVFWQREEPTNLAVTNIGTDNLGVLLGRMYRENAIMSGCFPLGSTQTMSADLKIKVPDRMQKIKVGDLMKITCYARGTLSTDTRTDSFRLLVSSQFKAYS